MNARVHEMNARVHTDRSIDRSNRFDRYAWFNRHQPTNQPTNLSNKRSINSTDSIGTRGSIDTNLPNKQTIDRSIGDPPFAPSLVWFKS
jgi:hypothetical protein